MDQLPVQSISPLPSSPSLVKKFLPILLSFLFFVILLFGALFLFGGRQVKEGVSVTPSPRPTATPFLAPTLPLVSFAPGASPSASLSISNKLVFIKDGDIYQSDFSAISLLVKNSTPAADKLMWSPKGTFLSWREKSNTAIPSRFTVYNRIRMVSFSVNPLGNDNGELVDLAFSPDESAVAALVAKDTYTVNKFTLLPTTVSLAGTLIRQTAPIKQILWPAKDTLLLVGSLGISRLDIASSSAQLIVDNKQVQQVKLSPDKKKLVYSVGDTTKSDLYLINIDGSENRQIEKIPSRVDMGGGDIPAHILEKGFIANVAWYPTEDKLLVGYHYLTSLPLIGVYDFTRSTFQAFGPFTLYNTDMVVDMSRLVVSRVDTANEPPSWQTIFYTLSGEPKFGVVRVIPYASSPAFFYE